MQTSQISELLHFKKILTVIVSSQGFGNLSLRLSEMRLNVVPVSLCSQTFVLSSEVAHHARVQASGAGIGRRGKISTGE